MVEPEAAAPTKDEADVSQAPENEVSRTQGTNEAPSRQHSGAAYPALRRPSRSRAPQARLTGSNRLSNASPSSEKSMQTNDGSRTSESKRPPLGILGICALDAKARSKPSRNILNRINAKQEFEVIIFGDKVILDESPENWPVCDYLISFFSDGFPLDKAIEYVRLRKPFTVNDLPMQRVLWDRRICLQILDQYEVATPKRLEVNRDGGPRLESKEMARHLFERTGVQLPGPKDGTGGGEPSPQVVEMLDVDTLSVDGKTLKKPFVEKPVSGEDHNIQIYYSSDVGGGGRRLFRKINNKSSEADDSLNVPRSITDKGSSFIYEKFLSTQNHEDVKAYTVGPKFCHAETRKSPVVDGIVKRNTHGKEMRYITSLTPEEVSMATKISEAFGQRICGFDMLRVGNKSFVIDVNGWSFVKDNTDYYDKCAEIMKAIFVEEKSKREGKPTSLDGEGVSTSSSPTRSAAGHLEKVKNMLKSPSMPRLHGSNTPAGGRSHGRSSPESLMLGSISASTTRERGNSGAMRSPGFSGPKTDPLPVPSLPTAASDSIASEGGLDQDQQQQPVPPPASKSQWKLKGMVAVIRHADRTPKQKWKFTFHTKPFVDLLKGHREEVLLVGEAALGSVMEATLQAMKEGEEDPEKLRLLRASLAKKGGWPGTKVQIKPMFSKKKGASKHSNADAKSHGDGSNSRPVTAVSKPLKEISDSSREHANRQGSLSDVTLSREAAAQDNLDIEKLQLIIKWGGEPTHSARYQSQELGENMRNDLLLMNRDAIDDLAVYSSSERRSTTSAQLWTAAFLDRNDVKPNEIEIRKDLLDDSNAAKDETDKVKKKLKDLLRKGNKAPPQFAWPGNMPEPYIVARNVVELMKFHRLVMRDNFQSLYGGTGSSTLGAGKSQRNVSTSGSPSGLSTGAGAMTQVQNITSVQSRWCCGEDPDLFKERWEKLFDEFCDPEKVDPSKISELHDTMKFDALHNRQFLEWVFTPSPQVLESFNFSDIQSKPKSEEVPGLQQPARSDTSSSKYSTSPSDAAAGKAEREKEKERLEKDKPAERGNFAQFMGFKKRDPAQLAKSLSEASMESYFHLFAGSPKSKSKTDLRLEKLRELFLYSKVLFDFIGPQEYGILDSEKLEIGLLTSLPLLRAIINDLEDMQASEGAKTTAYFTKESHIYTLLNCIIEGGVQTKIERNKIPELDYLSTICFELYESPNENAAADDIAADDDESKEDFNYSIRITISPGCHTFEPLDVQLDSRHTIGFAQRRSLTAHHNWKQVIETLRDKFHTVKLPQSFIAVNLSEKVPQAFGPLNEGETLASAAELSRENSAEASVP